MVVYYAEILPPTFTIHLVAKFNELAALDKDILHTRPSPSARRP